MRTVRVLSAFYLCVYLLATGTEVAAQDPPIPPPAPPQTAPGAGALKAFNPDIAVVGDFLTTAGKNDVNPSPVMELHESELSFLAAVDPYARADFFFAVGEEGIELEEGYITFPALPGKFLLRAGKMRASFGKVNTMHSHILPWTDRPVVTDSLVGGDEGIGGPGFSLSPRLFEVGGVALDTTLQVFRGDAGDVFQTSQRRDLMFTGRLHGYGDISESVNADVGFSYARGHNDAGIVSDIDVGRFRTALYGVDATVRWRPLSRSIYRGFSARSEVIWSQRGDFNGRQDSMGYYVSAEYQFARRWFLGGRYDSSEQSREASIRDTGQSLLVTFRPSEFSQVRGQYRRTDYGVGSVAHEVVGQLMFVIGAHSEHPFY